jgi:hypothetical protein
LASLQSADPRQFQNVGRPSSTRTSAPKRATRNPFQTNHRRRSGSVSGTALEAQRTIKR